MSAEGYAAGRHAQAYVETEKKVDIAQPPGFDDGPGAAEHPLRPAETGAGSDQRACQLVRLSVRATASPMTTWPSWPQACIVPGRCDAHPCLAGRCVSTASRIGKASRSARIATVGPECAPSISATQPVPGCPVGDWPSLGVSRRNSDPTRTEYPIFLRRSTAKAVVSLSSQPSSGRACRKRRSAIRDGCRRRAELTRPSISTGALPAT